MRTSKKIHCQTKLSPLDKKEGARQVAILNLWAAYDLVDDIVTRKLIAFAINRMAN